jgi:hypothetical protein
VKVIPVRETSPVVRKKSSDLTYIATDGSGVKRTHQEVYRDLMRKDAERQERRKSAQILAEVSHKWCGVVCCGVSWSVVWCSIVSCNVVWYGLLSVLVTKREVFRVS